MVHRRYQAAAEREMALLRRTTAETERVLHELAQEKQAAQWAAQAEKEAALRSAAQAQAELLAAAAAREAELRAAAAAREV